MMPCREREESRLDAFQKSEGKLIPTWEGVKILRARPTDRGEKVKEREKCVSIFSIFFFSVFLQPNAWKPAASGNSLAAAYSKHSGNVS